jgi:hypothetical protein
MPSPGAGRHPLTPEEYYASRPPVFVAAGVLLRSAAGDVLLVKPTYEPRWVIPGGAQEAAAVRLPPGELSEHRFVRPADLGDHIGGLLLRRVRAGLAVGRSGVPVDLEDGRPAGGNRRGFGA